MPEAVRINDTTTTGHGCDTTTTVVGGSENVFINNRKAERKGDPTATHLIGPPCVNHIANINEGSPNVFVNNKAMARLGDSTDEGKITSGSENVFCN